MPEPPHCLRNFHKRVHRSKCNSHHVQQMLFFGCWRPTDLAQPTVRAYPKTRASMLKEKLETWHSFNACTESAEIEILRNTDGTSRTSDWRDLVEKIKTEKIIELWRENEIWPAANTKEKSETTRSWTPVAMQGTKAGQPNHSLPSELRNVNVD